VRGLCLFGAAYVLSPIDLIPDFVPLLGVLDDTLVAAGIIWLALRLLPLPVKTESRARATGWLARGPVAKVPPSYRAAARSTG
jgi:uncharacterized membrane protein YkvA (DUF1232 family)